MASSLIFANILFVLFKKSEILPNSIPKPNAPWCEALSSLSSEPDYFLLSY